MKEKMKTEACVLFFFLVFPGSLRGQDSGQNRLRVDERWLKKKKKKNDGFLFFFFFFGHTMASLHSDHVTERLQWSDCWTSRGRNCCQLTVVFLCPRTCKQLLHDNSKKKRSTLSLLKETESNQVVTTWREGHEKRWRHQRTTKQSQRCDSHSKTSSSRLEVKKKKLICEVKWKCVLAVGWDSAFELTHTHTRSHTHTLTHTDCLKKTLNIKLPSGWSFQKRSTKIKLNRKTEAFSSVFLFFFRDFHLKQY